MPLLLGTTALAALAAQPQSAAPNAWLPHGADGATRYSALGLFGKQSALTPVIAQVAKAPNNPLFQQDKPWEPRLDNGCEYTSRRCWSHPATSLTCALRPKLKRAAACCRPGRALTPAGPDSGP